MEHIDQANEHTSKLDRFLLSIMGPAQRGQNRAPDGYVPDREAERCPRCHKPWTEHERRHKDNITYLRCTRALILREP